MGTVVDSGAAEERAAMALPADVLLNILRRASEASRGYSHALVCKDWAALALSAQLACACTCKAAGDDEEGVEASELLRELSKFPNLTSLDITAMALPESFSQKLSRFQNLSSLDITAKFFPLHLPPSFLSSSLKKSLKHLGLRGEDHRRRRDADPLQGLPRLHNLETLCLLTHSLPSDAWPLSLSLRHLDLGGMGEMVPFQGNLHAGERHYRGVAALPEGLLERIPELRELRVFRANLPVSVQELPDSMSKLVHLEELNLWANGLQSLFPGIGECQKLSRLLINTWGYLTLPESLTQLPSLSFMYLSAEMGVEAPRGVEALASLHTIEMSGRWHTTSDVADALFHVPSLQRLHTTGLPTDMSMLTSLRELVLNWNPFNNFPESLWSLSSLRVLILEDQLISAIPESIRGLSSLEELEVIQCRMIRELPDSLAELPRLKRLILVANPELRALPSSICSWPSLKALHLKDLPQLRLPDAVLSGLRLLGDLRIDGCTKLRVGEDERRHLILENLDVAAVPEYVRGMSALEELEILECRNIKDLQDFLAELPRLRKLMLGDNPKLRSLPSSIRSWPSLQSLHLRDLPQLRLSKAVLSELRLLKGLRVDRCSKLKGLED